MLIFFCGLIHLRHVSFSEGTHIVPGGVTIVNDGRKIARQKGGAQAEKIIADSCCHPAKTCHVSFVR